MTHASAKNTAKNNTQGDAVNKDAKSAPAQGKRSGSAVPKTGKKPRRLRWKLWLVVIALLAMPVAILASWPLSRPALKLVGTSEETLASIDKWAPAETPVKAQALEAPIMAREPALTSNDVAQLERKTEILQNKLAKQDQQLAQMREQQRSSAANAAVMLSAGAMEQVGISEGEAQTFQAMQGQIDRLNARLNQLEQELAAVPVDGGKQFALLATLWQLEQKAKQGEPFRYELIALKQQLLSSDLDGRDALLEQAANLEAAAREGVTDIAVLHREFSALAGPLAAGLRHADDSEGGGWFDWMGAMVTVRQTDGGGRDLDGYDSAVLRIEQALAGRDLETAVHEARALQKTIDTLPRQDGLERFEFWLEKADGTHTASSTLRTMFSLLLVRR